MIFCQEIKQKVENIKKPKKPRKKCQLCLKCPKYGSFNYPGEKGVFCKTHKSDDMVDIKHPICQFQNCETRSGFNFENLRTPIFCSKHIHPNMVETGKKTCLECKKKAVYNLPSERRGIYCVSHKKNQMVDVENKKCLKCTKQPHFNYPQNIGGILCSTHKEPDMVNVTDKKCCFENCMRHPSFNYKTETVGIYCSQHKLEKMENVIDKKCLDLECNIKPCFNYKTETVGIYCSQHKKENMVDVNHKKCLECDTRPNFNYENEKSNPLYCVQHKKENMVDVTPRKICKTYLCQTRTSNPQYEDYCLFCFMNTFPDKPIARNFKTKEKTIKEFIFSQFPNQTWVWDKPIQDGCSMRRPDFVCDCGEKIIIIEVDENQHTNYDSTCEITRLNQLSHDVYFRPIVMIRFNPDCYTQDGDKIKGSWQLGKDGIIHIVDTKEWNNRLKTLKQTIQTSFHTTTTNLVEFHHLFYDT
jgi:hypothetical protein